MLLRINSMIKVRFNSYWENLYFRAFIYSLLSFLILRIFTSLIMLIGIIHPISETPFPGIITQIFTELNQQKPLTRIFLAPWYRWDTAQYMIIANYGYDFNLYNAIWPPLYPFLIKIAGFVFQSSIFAALLVSNIFFVTGLWLLFLYTNDLFGEQVAKNTLFYLIVFPTSFFFVAGYTESMFLTFTVAVFLLLGRKKWMWAGIISALAVLTRVQGILLILPIFVELTSDYLENKNIRVFITNLIFCLYAPFAYGLFSLYVRYGLNTNWPWTFLSSKWDQHFGLPWEGIIGSVQVFMFKNMHNYNPTPVNLLNVVFSLSTIYFLIYLRKKIPLSLSIYCWVMMILILGKMDIDNVLISTIRYVLVLFPIYISQALLIQKKGKLIYTSVSMGLMGSLIMVFYWWLWLA